MLHNFARIFVFLLAVGFVFSGCSPKEQNHTDNTASFSSFIQAYSGSSISKVDPIYIDIRKSVAKDFTEEQVKKAFFISPKVSGKFSIEDNHIIVFTPSESLKSAAAYNISLDLEQLVNAELTGDKTLSFTCNVVPQSMYTTLTDYIVQGDNRELILNLRLTDKESLETLSSALALKSQSGTIPFKLDINGLTDFLLTARLPAEMSNGKLSLVVDQSALQLAQASSFSLDLPQKGDFALAFTQNNSPNQIDFLFNQELDASQNLNGLIKLSDGKTPTVKVSNNKLSVFVPASGEVSSISISKSLKTKSGQSLKTSIEHAIIVNGLKPVLSAVGVGHIVPTSGKVVFPFEAAGLKSVQLEIFKIHADNLQQFYQLNEMSSYYNLEYVGERVHNEKVMLSNLSSSYNPSENRLYVFDLFDFIKQEPNALYEVKIGFTPDDAVSECAMAIEDIPTTEDESIFDYGYYGIYGYYDGYDYKDRENPCKKAYYETDKFIKKMLLSSNLGIIAKKENNGDLHVFVTSILDAEPYAEVKVEVFNKSQRSLSFLKTDGNGQAHFTNIAEAFMVKVTMGSDENWLRIQDSDALNMSKFDLSGRAKKNGIDGFLYGERAVWRPGDSLFLDFILHDPLNKLPAEHPVTLSLENPRGAVVFKQSTNLHQGPIYSFVVPTQTDYITGDYLATVQVGANSFRKFAKIENIKPNKFAIKSNLSQVDLTGMGQQLIDKGVELDYQVDWLYGAPAKNKKLEVELSIKRVSTTFEKHKEFRFTDIRSNWYTPPTEMLASTTTDESGAASVRLRYKDESMPPGKLGMTLKATAYEASGDFSTDVSSTQFSPYDGYVGILLPRDLYGDSRVAKDKEANIEFVVVSDQGAPLSDRQVDINIYRMENYWWWNNYNDEFDTRSAKGLISQDRFTTKTNGQGKTTVKPIFADYGRYYVQACDQVTGHCTGDYLYVGYVWDNGDVNESILENATQMNLSVEQESYRPGQTVSLSIPSYFEGKALVSLENGDQVLDAFWTEVRRGNNKVDFTAQANMFPTVYAHVTMLQKHADKTNDMPIRSYGVVPVKISDDALELQPRIASLDSYKPQQKVEINVSESSGKAMNYTIAIVEEGLLNLTNFKTPNPFDELYAKPSLGVKTIDMFNDVLSAFGADITELYAIGGDGAEVQLKNDVKASRFKPVVQHIGPFYLAKGKKNKHEITIPNYIGAVRIMVVAADEAAYGSAEKIVPVKQDLMVLATLPRTLSPGDQLNVPVTVFGMKDNIGAVSVDVDAIGDFLQFREKSAELNFTSPDEKMQIFSAQVTDQEGIAKLGFSARSSQLTTTQEIEIQVENPNPISRRSTSKLLQPGESWSSQVSSLSTSPSQVIFSANSLAPISIEDHFQRLHQYPYGCLEQRISAAFAALYQGDLMELNTAQKQRGASIVQRVIDDLYKFKLPTGYATWPGASYYNDWVTSYLGDFLAEARRKGYQVPDRIVNNLTKDLASLAGNWTLNDKNKYTKERSMVYQAYRLFALAQLGKPLLNEMNRMTEDYQLSRQAAIVLAASYAVAGRKDQASQLMAKSSSLDRVDSYDAYSNAVRNHALLTLMYHKIGKDDQFAESMLALNSYLENQSYLSTNTAAFVFRALARASENVTDRTVQMELEWMNNANTLSSSDGAVYMESELGSSQDFTIRNTSSQPLYLQATVVGKEELGTEVASAKNLSIKTEFLDTQGKPMNVGNMKQGTNVRVRTTVTKPSGAIGNFDELALRQVMPSGWEIVNNRALGFDRKWPEGVEYQDFKDNSVNSFFSIEGRSSITIEILAKATYQGDFYFPKTTCEHMYSNQIFAESAGFGTIVN